MKNIDIKDLYEIKEDLDCIEDVIFVDDNNETKYAILPIDEYDDLVSLKDMVEDKLGNLKEPSVKIISNKDSELTYEEYEKIRKQLVDVFDATFKPKPEKLN